MAIEKSRHTAMFTSALLGDPQHEIFPGAPHVEALRPTVYFCKSWGDCLVDKRFLFHFVAQADHISRDN